MKSADEIIKEMGEKYLCHAKNQVKRLRVPLADSAGTDLCKTFKRFKREQERMAQTPVNVTELRKKK